MKCTQCNKAMNSVDHDECQCDEHKRVCECCGEENETVMEVHEGEPGSHNYQLLCEDCSNDFWDIEASFID